MTFLGAYTICPFDEVHRILDGRLQKHIFKCRQNYPQITKVTCPFDATHILDPNEYEHHLSECRSTGNIKCFEHSLEPDVKVGAIPIEKACNIETDVLNEDWSGSAPAYDPVAASEKKCVMRSTVGLSKKKRKQFKLNERERSHILQNHNNDKVDIKNAKPKQLELETPLRVPKEAAKAATYDLKSVIIQMREVSIDKSDKKVSPKKKSQESILNNTIKEKSDSVSSKNVSQCENKETTLQKEMDSSAIQRSSSEENINSLEKENIDASIHDTQTNNSKKHDKIKVQDLSHRNVVKEKSFQISPKIAATFYGQAKKISTGRGFTIACENLIPKTSKDQNESRNETLEAIRIAHGYDDDENDE